LVTLRKHLLPEADIITYSNYFWRSWRGYFQLHSKAAAAWTYHGTHH